MRIKKLGDGMEISSKLLQANLTQQGKLMLNGAQRAIIKHDDGPLLVIAGPGSGKTLSIILRAMNILLLGKAEPSQIVLCTFTEKAANEMQTRMMALANEVGYEGDLSGLRIGTIHGICNQLILEHRHHTPLGNDYRLLDQFEQWLFIFHHLGVIGARGGLPIFQEKWGTHWNIAKRLQEYFDKMMEELIDTRRLRADGRPFQCHLANAYDAYGKLLMRENCVSFAAQLRLAHTLLYNDNASQEIVDGIRYVFVDEYQDTNYIQEQIICQLSSATNNLCVVGDEDQALYRFRGATVRNILEFDTHHTPCTTMDLTTNYRSNEQIVRKYDLWMKSHNWAGTANARFRYGKTIEPDNSKQHPHYPAVFSIHGKDIYDEAEQFADCIVFLKEQGIVTSYDQIALLLRSVKPQHSNSYIEALDMRTIPHFCPRARSFFDRDEVRLLVACFAVLLGYGGENQGDGIENEYFAEYVRKECLTKLHAEYDETHPLQLVLAELQAEIANFKVGEEEQEDSFSLLNCFYRLLAVEPFADLVRGEHKMRNMVIFSDYLKKFQNFYHHTRMNCDTLKQMQTDFFSLFLCLLKDVGVNEYEDIERPLEPDHVQIMTIHQAKGLEFPVVIVGSLSEGHSGAQVIDRDLGKFYFRKEFEPESRIPGFDMMRLYYVAFSRAEQLLVLTGNSHRTAHKLFHPLLQDLPQWPEVRDELIAIAPCKSKEPAACKPRYSFTADVQVYETCPRQYEYFRTYNFAPARQREVFLGLLVHQTIEEIHHIAIDGQFLLLDEEMIQQKLDRVYDCLSKNYPYPVPSNTKETALSQVLNYVSQNRREIQQVKKTEVDISLTKDDHIFTGRIDLLMEKDGAYEIMDFKVGPRPKPDADQLINYERQLYTYASAFEQCYHRRPAKLWLYWTEMPRREDALMEIPYHADVAERVNRSFDAVARSINEKDFHIATLPERHTCEHCDLQHLCISEGIISASVCV